MIRVGLTGGIGSGKSMVSAMLRQRGARLIDGDLIAREVVEPGQPALAALVERFGTSILRPDGTLDRAGLAAIVFHDGEALAAMNAIMLPRIEARARELTEAAAGEGAQVLVHDSPLLVETGQQGRFDAVLVVTAPLDVRLDRLTARGVDRADAEARMAAQATDDQRAAVADFVIDNGGTPSATQAQVDRIWAALIDAGER